MMNEPFRTCENNASIPGHSKKGCAQRRKISPLHRGDPRRPVPVHGSNHDPIAPGTTQYLSHTVVITNQRTSSGLAFQIIGGCSHKPRAVISSRTV